MEQFKSRPLLLYNGFRSGSQSIKTKCTCFRQSETNGLSRDAMLKAFLTAFTWSNHTEIPSLRTYSAPQGKTALYLKTDRSTKGGGTCGRQQSAPAYMCAQIKSSGAVHRMFGTHAVIIPFSRHWHVSEQDAKPQLEVCLCCNN